MKEHVLYNRFTVRFTRDGYTIWDLREYRYLCYNASKERAREALHEVVAMN